MPEARCLRSASTAILLWLAALGVGSGPLAQTITTFAGGGIGDGAPAVNAILTPMGMVRDSSGNIFVADYGGHRVRKITPAGIITTIAGTGIAGYGGDGGPAVAAQLNYPYDVGLDAAGNLYVVDSSNYRIRKIAADGVITTAVGNGSASSTGDGGPATAASINSPSGIAFDASGNMYINEANGHRIRRVTPGGIVSTFAGNGSATFAGDGGLATNASFYFPNRVAVDSAGNVYVADWGNHRIRKILPSGQISTIAGNGSPSSTGDGGPATSASIAYPHSMDVDAAGNVFISEGNRVRKVNLAGVISTVAGTGVAGFNGDGGPATNALINGGNDVLVDPAGNIYLGENINNRIRRIDTSGTINTYAGNAQTTFAGDGGPGSAAGLLNPNGVSYGAGSIFIVDYQHHRIRKVGPDGIVSTIAGNGAQGFSGDGGPAVNASLNYPYGSVAVDAQGNVYFSDYDNNRVRRIAPNGDITTIAGNGSAGYGGDNGPAINASLYRPSGVIVDGNGNLFIADLANWRVRKVVLATGIITTYAGNGSAVASGDGGPAINAGIHGPNGIALDSAGNMFVADVYGQRIRRISAGGVISTVAGTGAIGGAGDGGPATSATFYYPHAVAVDGAGQLFITDNYNHRVRKVDANGVITTLAGTGVAGLLGDGGAAADAQLNYPSAVGTDPHGNVYIADVSNHRIRKVAQAALMGPVITSPAPSAGTFGVAYTHSVTATGNPTASFTITAGSVLPPGVSLSPGGALAGTPGAAGTYAGSFQASNGIGSPGTQAYSIVIAKAAQAIGFGALPGRALGEAPFQVTATPGGSGNAVVFSSLTTGVCTSGGSNGATITLVAVGTCTIAANQAGGANHEPAPQVTRSFNVAKGAQAISFAPLPDRTLGDGTFQLTAGGGASGNPVTFASQTISICTTTGANGATVSMLAVGTCTIAANQAGNANYDPALQVTRSFAVGRPGAGPAVTTSATHSLAVNTLGHLFAWGSDDRGQLGQGRAISRSTPTVVAGLPPVAHISLARHVLAVDTLLQVWSWGENSCGQLGRREAVATTKPSRVIGATSMTKVAAGQCFSLALKSDGTVWAWGAVPGYPGTGFRQIPGLAGVLDIAAGSRHALARTTSGAVYAFGDNQQGQLGLGITGAPQAAVQVPGLANVAEIAAGDVSSMVRIGTDNTVRFWGRHQDLTQLTSPTALPGLGGPAAAISVTGNRPYAARGDGALLGYGATSGTWTPEFAGFSGITAVSAGNTGFVLGIMGTNGQLFAGGANSGGQLGQGNTNAFPSAVAVPGFSATAMVRTGALDASVLALRQDGSVWFWGADTSGESGDGTLIGSSVPRRVTVGATIESTAAGDGFSAAVDSAGNVWAWGNNVNGVFGASRVSRPAPELVPIAGGSALAVAAGGSRFLAYLLVDGTVWFSGTVPQLASAFDPVAIPGLASIKAIAAGEGSIYALRNDGIVFAVGDNASGELGNGSNTASGAPVMVQGITGTVTRISAARFRAGAVTSDGKVWTWGAAPLGTGSTLGSFTAVNVPGITDAVDISVGANGAMVRRLDGSIVAWGDLGLVDAAGSFLSPYAVPFPTPVRSLQAGRGNSLGFVVGQTGLAWGFGRYGTLLATSASIGDGTYVKRDRPVVLLAAGAAGNIETNDWFLDLDPASPESVPAASVPRMLGESRLFAGGEGLFVNATVRYRSSDFNKTVGNYVLGLVPPAFFNHVKSAPGLPGRAEIAKRAQKNGGFVPVMLTPQGWLTLSGQMVSFSQGVASAAGGAANIADHVPMTEIKGAKFCIGYGEDPRAMLNASTLREVLEVEGAQAQGTTVPCVLPGVYVTGPPGSRQGTPVSFKAMVVGPGPTGSVQFRDGVDPLSQPAALTPSNGAVSAASVTVSTLPVGQRSIGAAYLGDAQNAAATTNLPLRHLVEAVPPGETRTTLEGPASSARGAEVTFVATVIGTSPTGTVQFKDFAANLGAPVPLVDGIAAVRVSTLEIGLPREITALYSGDVNNAPSASATLVHKVSPVLNATVALAGSASTAPAGTTVQLTATVTGNNPTGSVTFRDGATSRGTVNLSAGQATLGLAFDPGLRQLVAEYSGDGNNNPNTSDYLFLEVTLPGVQLVVSKLGSGSGTVTSAPAGIACGITCTANFDSGASVTLSAAADAGSSFAGWGGACSGTGACVVAMSAAQTVTATFNSAGGGGLTLQPAALAFGGQSMQTTSAPLTVTLTNPGGAAVSVSTVTTQAPFAVTHNCGTLAAGAACTASVTFTPAIEGAAQGVLAIVSSLGTQNLALGGTGELSLVKHFYRAILNRAPEPGGQEFWEGERQRLQAQGANVNEIWFVMANYFFNSAEYTSLGKTNDQFLTDVYNTFFNRPPDGGGMGFWQSQMAAGLSREGVIFWFMFSNEFRTFTQGIFGSTAARPEVDMVMDLFRGLLNRFPDTPGLNAFVGSLRQAQCAAPSQRAGAVYKAVNDISYYFIFDSGEYANRNRTNAQYVSDMYNAFLRRGGTDDEVDFWINQLGSGASDRNTLRASFIATPEFGARVDAVISAGCVQ